MRRVEIIGITTTMEDVFFILSIDNNGMKHTEKISRNMFIKALEKGLKAYIDIDDRDLYFSVINSDLRYMEIQEYKDDVYNKNEVYKYDVYIYNAIIDYNEVYIDYDREESYLYKTYKDLKSAENLAKKLKIKHIIYT